jgi:hypothetical protein
MLQYIAQLLLLGGLLDFVMYRSAAQYLHCIVTSMITRNLHVRMLQPALLYAENARCCI